MSTSSSLFSQFGRLARFIEAEVRAGRARRQQEAQHRTTAGQILDGLTIGRRTCVELLQQVQNQDDFIQTHGSSIAKAIIDNSNLAVLGEWLNWTKIPNQMIHYRTEDFGDHVWMPIFTYAVMKNKPALADRIAQEEALNPLARGLYGDEVVTAESAMSAQWASVGHSYPAGPARERVIMALLAEARKKVAVLRGSQESLNADT